MIHTNAVNIFISSLSAGSLARIERILDELVRDIKAGKKEPSVISTATCEAEDDELAWGELERELVGDGITRQDVERYKEDIKEHLKKLIQETLTGVGASSSVSLDVNFDNLQLSPCPSTDSLRAESLKSNHSWVLGACETDATFESAENNLEMVVPQPETGVLESDNERDRGIASEPSQGPRSIEQRVTRLDRKQFMDVLKDTPWHDKLRKSYNLKYGSLSVLLGFSTISSQPAYRIRRGDKSSQAAGS